MSLQAYDSPDEVKRITKALDSYPKCYVSLRPNKRGIVMARGIPTTSDMSLDDAFHYCALRPDSRTDIVWDGVKGAWREAKEVM
jgi:hypothetical protein